jgi:hypothetical protein
MPLALASAVLLGPESLWSHDHLLLSQIEVSLFVASYYSQGHGEVCTGTESESESYVTTDSQSASLSWNKAPIWGLRPDIYLSLTITAL